MILIKWALNVVPAVRIFREIATPQWSMFCMRKKNQINYGKSNYENYKKISMKLSFFDWHCF